MGRQAHLTRLALGRSPYADPLRDVDGNFVVGPSAHKYNNSDYEQHFDSRGHPRNPASRVAARRLRRAQNDVLAAVGVVVRKEEATKSEWERLNTSEKNRLVIFENQSGRELKANDRIAGAVVPWFLVCLRRRVLTFTPYSSLPISTLLQAESRSMGVLRIIHAGLPFYLLSCLPQMYRYYIRIPDVEEIVNYVNPEGSTILDRPYIHHLIHDLVFCLELPLHAFSVLQGMQVIAPGAWMDLSTLIPFGRRSPINLPPLPTSLSVGNAAAYISACAQTPLGMSIVRDFLHMQIGYRIYALIRQVMTYADRPDCISAATADAVDIIEETSIPGVGYPRVADDHTRLGRRHGPRSFAGAFRIAFPTLYRIVNFFTGGTLSISGGRLKDDLNSELRLQVRKTYESRLSFMRQNMYIVRGGFADTSLQREITYSVFSMWNLDPDEELVDPVAWTESVMAENRELRRLHRLHLRRLWDRANDYDTPWDNVRGTRDELLEILHTVSTVSNTTVNDSLPGSPFLQTPILPDTPQLVDAEAAAADMISAAQVEDIDVQTSPLHAQEDEHSNAEIDPETPASELHPTQSSPPAPPNTTPPSEPDNTPLPSPRLGISRAVSLTEPATNNLLPFLQRIRNRRTQTELTSTDLTPQYRNFGLEPSTTSLPSITPIRRSEHRVTLLSTFAIDSFAWHASAILTSFILLPIESMYLRSLVRWITESDHITGAGVYLVGSPMFGPLRSVFGNTFRPLGMGEWFGGSATAVESGRLKYMSAVLLTLGLEAMVRGGIWYIGAQRALYRGEKFGWGKF